jgi:hypothetical protein
MGLQNCGAVSLGRLMLTQLLRPQPHNSPALCPLFQTTPKHPAASHGGLRLEDLGLVLVWLLPLFLWSPPCVVHVLHHLTFLKCRSEHVSQPPINMTTKEPGLC